MFGLFPLFGILEFMRFVAIFLIILPLQAQDLWGPFLIIAPASTLHNWQQELSRFVSKFKVRFHRDITL